MPKGAFYAKVDQKFYDEVKQENGGKLPKDLMDASGKPRKLTMSSADRAYRKQWQAIANKERKSQAVAKKEVESACAPCQLKAAGAKIPPILLPAKKDGKPTKLTLAPANGAPPSQKKKKEQQTGTPCKNKTLTVECSHSGERKFKLELPAKKVTQFEVIDDGKEKITCTTQTTGPCGQHAGKVFDLYPDDVHPVKTNEKLEFRAVHDPAMKSWPFLKLFSGSASSTTTYTIRTDTCQQEESLSASVVVYPQVDWDIDISLWPATTDSGSTKTKHDTAAAGLKSEAKSELSFSGKFGVTVCGSKVEYGEEISQELDQALKFANLAMKATEFCSKVASALGGVEIEFKHPDLHFQGKWGRKELDASPKVGYWCDLAIAFSPLIGASVKLDILSFALTKIPALGPVVERLRKSVKDAIDIAVFLKLEGEVGGAFHYVKVVAQHGDCSGKVDGKIEFTIEAHIETKQFRWFCLHAGAQAKVGGKASLSGEVIGGVDGEGGYYSGQLKFDGLAIYAVLAGGIGFSWDDPPPEKDDKYEAPEAPEEGGVGAHAKIDTSGVEGSVLYKDVWTLIDEHVLLGGEEKHRFVEGSEEE